MPTRPTPDARGVSRQKSTTTERRAAGISWLPMPWKAIVLLLTALPVWGASCDSLAKLAPPHTTITLAETSSAWPTTLRVAAPKQPFCRVAATLTPSDDSHIEIEVWM